MSFPRQQGMGFTGARDVAPWHGLMWNAMFQTTGRSLTSEQSKEFGMYITALRNATSAHMLGFCYTIESCLCMKLAF